VPDGRHYYTRIGIGLDALTIRDTARKAKRRFGRLAYAWAAFTRLIGYQPGRFRISVDDRANHPRASQVVLANCGTMCRLPLRWGSGIRPDDGRVEVCIIRARNLIDYVVLAAEVLSGRQRSSRHMTYMVARRDVLVAADITLPVQADGDIIGETPIRVRIMTGDMPVIVPEGRNSP
jgi:diacylglycerol kinase (ATP)